MSSTIANPQPGLVFGGLDMLKSTAQFEIAASGSNDGTSWGKAVPITRAINSYLQDGSLVETTGYDNRDGLVVYVLIKAKTSAGLAAGEAALMAEIQAANAKGSTLTWTPPDGWGKACVFDILAVDLGHTLKDDDENNRRRRYTLTFTALPFARSEDPSTFDLGAPVITTPTVTVIDACSSTTGWTATGQTTGPVVANGGISAYAAGANKNFAVSLKKAFSQSMAGMFYVRLKFSSTQYGGTVAVPTTVKLNNVVALLSATAAGGYGWYRFTGSTLTSVQVTASGHLDVSGAALLVVQEVAVTNSTAMNPYGGLQQVGAFPVDGTVRTQGSIFLDGGDSPADSLGDVLVYTSGDDTQMAPPLSGLITGHTGAGPVTDVDAVSGRHYLMHNGDFITYSIPTESITPGAHAIMARFQSTGSAANVGITWTVEDTFVDLGDNLTDDFTIDFPVGWTVALLGVVPLPYITSGPDGETFVSIENTGDDLLLDELWLFNLETGRLTWFTRGGTVAPWQGPSRAWLDAPTAQTPVPRVWIGNADDRSDAWVFPQVLSLGNHEFVPPTCHIFVVTSGVPVEVSGSYFPRFHTHVV